MKQFVLHAPYKPTGDQPDAIAKLHVRDMITHSRHFPHDLVSGHERELRHSPLIVHHAQIAVADPAGFNADINFVRVDVSEFELEQTEANRDLAVSDANIIEVRIRQIDDLLQRADVRAPFPGVVIERSRRTGEEVARGEVLGQLTDIEHLEVRAFVPLKHLPRTSSGEAIDVFATDAAHTGSIRSLVPTGDVRSQTFEARIDLPVEASGTWTVGQLVSVGIPIRSGEQTLAIPRDALVLRQDGSYVFRINDENKAERIAVDIGDSAGELIGVTGALARGDRVAVRGAENLREGVEVKIMVSSSVAAISSASEGA